jgi:hypothetical protein
MCFAEGEDDEVEELQEKITLPILNVSYRDKLKFFA